MACEQFKSDFARQRGKIDQGLCYRFAITSSLAINNISYGTIEYDRLQEHTDWSGYLRSTQWPLDGESAFLKSFTYTDVLVIVNKPTHKEAHYIMYAGDGYFAGVNNSPSFFDTSDYEGIGGTSVVLFKLHAFSATLDANYYLVCIPHAQLKQFVTPYFMSALAKSSGDKSSSCCVIM